MNMSVEKFRRNTSDQKADGWLPSFVENSRTKLTETEESHSDEGDVAQNRLPTQMTQSFNVEGVRFSPKVIEFVDAFEGKQFAVKTTIQNVGKNPVSIRIGEPNSFIFQIKKPMRRARLLAAGASITKTVTYCYHNDDLVQRSLIPVQINGRLVDYPIVVRKAVPEIEVEPTKLDFKIINLGASVKPLVLTIRNTGGKRTKFEIDVGKNDLDLVVNPLRGTIMAKSMVKVAVEIMGLIEGEHYKELWVTTNEMPIRVPVLVQVVRPRLEIIHPNRTEDFTLINFEATFNGTQRADSFVLKNYSAETTLFITLAESGGELQFLEEARKVHGTFGMFQLTAEEGRLDPFESRILTVLFRPNAIKNQKGWRHEENEKAKKTQWQHIVFFRINRVHCIERNELAKVEAKIARNPVEKTSASLVPSMISLPTSMLEVHGKAQRVSDFLSGVLEANALNTMNSVLDSSDPLDEKVLRLCLHGNALEPDILFQPSSLEFGELQTGQMQKKVLRITNCTVLPMKIRFGKTMNVSLDPKEENLKAEGAQEFLVSLTPTCAGRFKAKIMVKILAESDVVYKTDKALVTIATRFVPFSYDAKVSLTVPVPKLVLGITPRVADEVGLNKELLKFKDSSRAPYSAVLLTRNLKPEWMKKEVDKVQKVDDAIIALPNDRPRAFYSWPKEKICRTIFKGFPRYSPPKDTTYTFTSQETIHRNRHRKLWSDYLSFLKELRQLNYLNRKELNKCLSEYEISCEKHHNMENYKLTSKFVSKTDNEEAFWEFVRGRDALPREALVPLSPMFLSNINVQPKLINFCTVASNTLVNETLTIENLNPFSISIRFIPGKSAVTVLEASTIAIPPSASKSLQVAFQTKDLGRYYGFLYYVINGSHEFKITISAFVTSKTLILDEKDLTVEFGKYPANDAFQPRSTFLSLGNVLQSPIKYRWVFPPDSAFFPQIIDGEVPPRSKILTEIVFDQYPRRAFYCECNLVSESGAKQLVKMMQPNKTVAVNFQTSRIDMHDVSLNLPTKARPVIQNACYHDVAFEVSNWMPMPGVVVEPKQGVIKARSFFYLDVKIQIPVVMKFAFDVVLCVHLVNKISVKITGNVVMPVIRMRPSEIVMRKICAQSFDTVMICAENVGTTPVEMTIDFKGCPEYKVVDDRCRIFLPPEKSSKFAIRFDPKDVARYVFYLPVIINKILGPPMMQEPVTEFLSFYVSRMESSYKNFGEVFDSLSSNVKIPCICINCTVSPGLLKISPLNVVFRSVPNSNLESQRIVISNNFHDDVTFCIRNDDLGEANGSPFTLIPLKINAVEFRTKAVKATLQKKEFLELEARFSPQKPGSYSAEIPVFVRGYNNGVVYNFISLRGEMKKPRLYPQCSEIHFPPLPLDVGCDAVISICAENYLTPDTITCIIWDSREGGDPSSDNLTVSWLGSPNVFACPGTQTLQVQVNFWSDCPVFIRNYLVFMDSEGEYCTVLVTGMSDNSAVSTHAFLTSRATKYRLIRDTPPLRKWEADNGAAPVYPVNKADLKAQVKGAKIEAIKSATFRSFNVAPSFDALATNNPCSSQIDEGPRLVIQVTKSMSRPTQLSFVNLTKNFLDCKNKGSSSTVLVSAKGRAFNSFISGSDSNSEAQTSSNEPPLRGSDQANDVTHPHFPIHDTQYGKHFQDTLTYVERWMYEVVMKCDQYFYIPSSFQKIKDYEREPAKASKQSSSKQVKNREKDFLDFLEEVGGPATVDFLPQRLRNSQKMCPIERAERLHLIFSEILCFLQNHGCLLPHVRPEFLLDYEDYLFYHNVHESLDTFTWTNLEPERANSSRTFKDLTTFAHSKTKTVKEKSPIQSNSLISAEESWKKSLFDEYNMTSDMEMSKQDEEAKEVEESRFVRQTEAVRHLVEGKQFTHQNEILDKPTFDSRTTQAWLDVVLQIFRNFVLTKVVYKNTIPRVTVVEESDKLLVNTSDLSSVVNCSKTNSQLHLDSLNSNLYTIQERILLTWLNYHFDLQANGLWKDSYGADRSSNGKMINNFDKDLADSIALIAVTASHCPYVVNDCFADIFLEPDTPDKMCHNAGKLVLVWRMLNLGLTVETADIVYPNHVFMIMLVAHLYEVLPSLHPRSLVCFSAPLTKELTRCIQLKNESHHRLFYQPKFLGEYEGLFRLNESSLIELKPLKSTELKITFRARKMRKVTATLILSGSVISPHFARDLAFYLEGEPSELCESEKFSFTGPLFKVLCTEIPVSPPYGEDTTYELWYTTERPVYKEHSDVATPLKPWSKIWNRKVSRRLFISKSEIAVSGGKPTTLGVTIACFTKEDRFFWLLFHSPKIGDFIYSVQVQTKVKASQIPLMGHYSAEWSPSAECLCGRPPCLKPNFSSCPFLTTLSIPTRNDSLWDSLWAMFVKTLFPQEKSFWMRHFEMNIGICLILWLLSVEEEEAVIDEFVHVLPTKVIYTLEVEPPENKYVDVPDKIEISDVREKSFIQLPVHISKKAPTKLKMTLKMTSENGKEIRTFRVLFSPSDASEADAKRKATVLEEPEIRRSMCQAVCKNFSSATSSEWLPLTASKTAK